MRALFIGIACLVGALAYSVGVEPVSAAQTAQTRARGPVGNAEAGKAVWATGNTSCRNCHGAEGEGAFGKTLAGQGLTFQKFRDYVRKPTGVMPAYIPSELTDQEIADLVAYFDTIKFEPKDTDWRTPPVDNPPEGQFLAIEDIGCAQCHGATLSTPRHGAAEIGGTWEWFKHMVYEHTTAQREHWKVLDPAIASVTPGPAGPPGRNRVRMGNYDRKRLPEKELRKIWDWVVDLGFLPVLRGTVSEGVAASNGVTYNVNVVNTAVKGKGISAEGVTVTLVLPAGAKVVSATGTGYQGVTADAQAKGDVATWQLPQLSPTERQALSITLAAAGDLRGNIRWAKPVVKADPLVNLQVTRPGGRGGRGGGDAGA
jgi:mono/diheme cytochrome c family protein